MPIQTASVEFTGTPEGGYYLLIKTPLGVAKASVDRAFIVPHTPPFIGVIETPSVPTAKKISAKKTKRASIAQETEVMEALGGRRHPGSGAIAGLQGDGKVRDKYRVEMKMTRKEGYRLDRKELSKLRGECRGSEAPLFVVDFVDKETGGNPDRWVLVPFETFQKLDQHVPPPHR